MVMYDNELKTKENKNWTKDKIEPQHTYLNKFGHHSQITQRNMTL